MNLDVRHPWQRTVKSPCELLNVYNGLISESLNIRFSQHWKLCCTLCTQLVWQLQCVCLIHPVLECSHSHRNLLGHLSICRWHFWQFFVYSIFPGPFNISRAHKWLWLHKVRHSLIQFSSALHGLGIDDIIPSIFWNN